MMVKIKNRMIIEYNQKEKIELDKDALLIVDEIKGNFYVCETLDRDYSGIFIDKKDCEIKG